MTRYFQSPIRLILSCVSFAFCMFFTSNCFIADMPKVKTEWSDFTIFWAKIWLPPAERERSILTCWIWHQYWVRVTCKSKTYLLHEAPSMAGAMKMLSMLNWRKENCAGANGHQTTDIWIEVSSTSHKKAAKQNYEVFEVFVWIRKRVV